MARQTTETLLLFHVLTLLQKELRVLRQKGEERAHAQTNGLIVLFRKIARGIESRKLDYG